MKNSRLQTLCNLLKLSQFFKLFLLPKKTKVFLNENLTRYYISLEASNTCEMVTILQKGFTKFSSVTFSAVATTRVGSP